LLSCKGGWNAIFGLWQPHKFNESIISWKKVLVFILIDGGDRLDFVWDAFQIMLSGDDTQLMPTLIIVTAQLDS